ncbi:iron uptake system protein EfeO [Frondihabitans australicus]|uniref:Iron uptake system component EfeO n=1 Tax=Frondihabitans australicus TaxID=386892 RepID=A0A495IBG1_9MICO|nr:iron uptake system protein EfeO [Frondihabitans australicus]RKR73337.1 iron uptake system component EfeO [Frondihabitans australicus]
MPLPDLARRPLARSLGRPLALVAAGTVVLLAAAGCTASAPAPSTTASAAVGVQKVSVTLVNDGSDRCTASTNRVAAGPVTFTVTNRSSTAITEFELLQDQRIYGEKENLVPGLASATFTVTLGGGTYQLYCPGAVRELTPFTVTGSAAGASHTSTAGLLRQGAKGYAQYVTGEIGSLVTASTTLQHDIHAGDLARAKIDCADARGPYEHIESDVNGFVKKGYSPTDNAGNLDYLIDMRATNLDPKVGWHGFHAIERDLFQAGRITASTVAAADGLVADVTALRDLASSLSYRPEDLANGASGLLEEVQRSKVTGTEDAYSHTDLVDIASNVEGARQAFAYLKPGLAKLDPAVTTTIGTQFDRTVALLNTYRDASAPGGYRTYDAATRAADANAISQQVQALQDPLSRLAAKVATA